MSATATVAVLAPNATITPLAETTPTPNITSFITAVPSVTVPADPHAPDFYVRQISPVGNQLDVDKAITYVLLVGNKAGTTTTTKTSSLIVTDVIPLGLKQITAKGTDWQISLSDTVGPAVLTAQYTGKLTADPNTTLPPISLTGILTQDAEPSITNTATVVVPDDKDMDNNTTVSTTLIGVQLMSSPTSGPPATSTIGVTRTPAPSWIMTVTPIAITHTTMTPTPRPTPTLTPKPRITPTPKPRVTPQPTLSPTPHIIMTPKPRVTPQPTIAPKPRITPTPKPRMTPTVVPGPIVGSRFSLLINRSGSPVGNHSTVGQKISYVLQVRVVQGNENQPVTVLDIVSVGLSHIYSTGPGWTIALSNTIGPAALKATFNGPYPIATGTVLPPLTIRGTITDAAVPMLSNAAVVTSNDDRDSADNVVVASMAVTAADLSAATTIPSPTAMHGSSAGLLATPTTRVPAATRQPTVLVSPTVKPDGTSGTKPAVVGPDLMLVNTNLYGNHAVSGAKVNFVLVVAKTTAAVAITNPKGIKVDEVIPLGLHNLQVVGKDWQISLSDTTSPAVIHAQYIGKIGPHPAAALSPISITGDLTADAMPILTSTASVDMPGDLNVDNNIASNTLFVQNAQPANAQNIKPHAHAYAPFWQSSIRKEPHLLLV
ncbi:hypothetical protein KDW_51960 [Dictyobacter vulcani]|uniref:DUF11 domain-containing protein n=2 Tax=Dictyobacter vulcani TaxID=2607529 RepID=A0A5J4KNU6_9CHLR|nr:hypothetical protein KDW_51960 [Dictyobacter vulcani]